MVEKKTNKEIRQIKDIIRSHLSDYLAELNLNPAYTKNNAEWYHCLSPDHDDRTPSMKFVKDTEKCRLICYGCGAKLDIFHIAHLYENKPITGSKFYQKNMKYLADKFGIPFELEQFTEEELFKFRIQQTYEDCATTLEYYSNKEPETAFTHIKERLIKDKVAKRFGVCTMAWDTFLKIMKEKYSYSEAWLRSIDITDKMIGLDYITFVLRNEDGEAVGLSRRWVNWTPEGKKNATKSNEKYEPKYLNSNSDKNLVYNKKNFLYGLFEARKSTSSRLDLVEGYLDFLALYQYGHKFVSAICGTALTSEQIKLIQDVGFNHINLVLDQDQAGIKSMDKYLRNLRTVKNIKVTVTRLCFDESVSPSDRDPHTWIARYGLEHYFNQPIYSGFTWELNKLLAHKIPPVQVVSRMINYIVNEKSAVEREEMINTLSQRTNISTDSISKDVENRRTELVDSVVESALYKAKNANTIDSKKTILSEANNRVDELISTVDSNDLSLSSNITEVTEITQSFLDTSPGLPGWNCGIKCINVNFGGIPKKKELIGFAGNPNTGKSTLLYNICYGLITNDNPNLGCVFWTLDDPTKTLYAKMLAIRTGYTINQCQFPFSYGLTNSNKPEHLPHRYLNGVRWLQDQVREQKLIVKGIEIGSRIEDCENWLKIIQNESQKDLVIFVDNFHSITGDSTNIRVDFKRAAEWMQKISDTMNVTFVCSLEPTKQAMSNKRPHMEHIAESSKIQFSFKLLGLVYNQMHEMREKAQLYWTDSNGQKKPIIQVDYEKNKITAFKGTHYFKFEDDRARLTEMTFEDIKQTMINEYNEMRRSVE